MSLGPKLITAITGALPATSWFLLSILTADQSSIADLVDCGEITGTGYDRQSQTTPTMQAVAVTFDAVTWLTGSAADWPWQVQSLVMATTHNNTGSVVCAWDIGAQDLSHPGDLLELTPVLSLAMNGTVNVVHHAA